MDNTLLNRDLDKKAASSLRILAGRLWLDGFDEAICLLVDCFPHLIAVTGIQCQSDVMHRGLHNFRMTAIE
jgi:hypothetical protein